MCNIETRYLTKNPCYNTKRTITVKGLMLHSVGCPQPNPLVFIKNWDRESYKNACVHGFIGENTAYITLPVMEKPGKAHRGWHGGGASNNTHIGVEMCEPGCIKYTGGANFTCSDKEAAVAYVEKVTRNAVELFATLCAYHDLDPLADGVIISHAEGHKRGIASNHGDPDHLWRQLGMDYSMDKFRADVAAQMKGGSEMPFTQDDFDKMMNNWLARREKENPADWSKEDREWAEKEGIIAGDGNGNMMYRAFATREHMIVFIHRLAEKLGL